MQQRAEATRTRLLEVALASFAEHGYDATGVADICKRAGVSKGAFYHHFPSKQALFLELLNAWLAALDAQMAAARSQTADVPDALLAMAGLFSQVFVDAAGQLPMFLEFWSQAARDPAVWATTIAPYQRYNNLFADMIAGGIDEGSLRAVAPDTAARVLVALALGLLLQGLLDPEGADWSEISREGVALLLEGMTRRSE